MSTVFSPTKMHAAASERVVVGAEKVMVHLAAVERMACAYVRRIALDTKILMIARHREHRRAKRGDLLHEQLVVASRLGFRHSQRVADEISRDEQDVWMNRIDDRAEALRAGRRLLRDMCVRRVHEREVAG
jgi:hypothetical protein